MHCVRLGEKHEVLELLWQQHTEEMLLLESSVFTLCGRDYTMEFQPSADMSWQNWACNELNQAATYSSPYANVHKGSLSSMGGSIGYDKSWQPYTNNVREEHLKKAKRFLSSLPATVSEKVRHDKLLLYMAENGIPSLDSLGLVSLQKECGQILYTDINAWQNMLGIIYIESVQRGLFHKLVKILSAPVG